jgi:hypothetical protein
MHTTIAGAVVEDSEALEMSIELEDKRDTMRAPKKRETKRKAKPAKTRSLTKASKRPHKRSSTKKDNGTVRSTSTGKIHVMSVHIPLSLLKRLDAKCAAAKKAGKSPDNRSAFAVQAISSRL